jgi:hypothetical protein
VSDPAEPTAEAANAGTEVIDPKTTGAETAPGSQEGQAGGSPPTEGDPTSEGNDGKTPVPSEGEKALRQRLTALGTEKSNVEKILNAAMQTPEWKAVEARLTGQMTADPEAEALDKSIFGEEGVATGKKWVERLKADIRKEILREMAPVAREVGNTVEEKTLVKALAAEGLAPSAEFETFKEDFAAENPSYEKVKRADPAAAAKWVASTFKLSQMRAGRTPVGGRADASLERGGGSSARAGVAASTVKIDSNDPQLIQKLLEAYKKGETPIDQNGHLYRGTAKRAR